MLVCVRASLRLAALLGRRNTMLLLLEHRDKPGDVGNPSGFLPVSTSLQGVQTLALEVRKGNGGVEETAWRTEDEEINQERTVCNPFVLIDF